MLKLTNYYVVQGYMITLLKLKGLELQVYAIIKGFSQDPNNYYTAPLSYLADFTQSTKQGVIKALKSLIDKGYIVKEEHLINNVSMPKYKAIIPNDLEGSTEFNGVKLSLMGGSTEFNGSIINKNINNLNNKVINKQNSPKGIDNSLSNNPITNKEIDNSYNELISLLNEL